MVSGMLTPITGHSPHGECGLKFAHAVMKAPAGRSLPAWGVRVEIDLIARIIESL